MKKVVVTGASGLFGSYLCNVFGDEYNVVPLLGRNALDITDTKKVISYFEKEQPDLIIHSAGFRDLDEAEKFRERTITVNTFGTKNIALVASKLDIPLVHISSDSVFDGDTDEPYNEYDKTNPINVYGYSKMMAEKEVMNYHRRFFIIRLPLLFGALGSPERNLIKTMAEKIERNEIVECTTDQVCSPTYCKDAAKVVLEMTRTDYYGLYHVSNQGKASRYEFCKKCAEFLNLPTDKIVPVLGRDKQERTAKRAKNTVFSSIAFKNTFNLELRNWEEALAECISEMTTK